MLIDAALLPSGHVLTADVCIVGSGPAALGVVHELLPQGISLCVIEAGDFDVRPENADYLRGRVIGDRPHPYALTNTRQLLFGGMSKEWVCHLPDGRMGVRHAVYSPIDFEKRDWIPYSGWPLGFEELLPYYERASAICQIGPVKYSGCDWADESAPCLPLKGNRVETTMFQFGPSAAFYQTYRDELEKAANATLCVNAHVTELFANPEGTAVTHLRAASAPGREIEVRARFFVLATGGVENARLLLLSDRVQKTGLGNANDLVGRFFMDHPFDWNDRFVPSSSRLFDQMPLYDIRDVDGTAILGKLTLTREAMESEGLMSMSCIFLPRGNEFNPSAQQRNAIKSTVQTLVPQRIRRGLKRRTRAAIQTLVPQPLRIGLRKALHREDPQAQGAGMRLHEMADLNQGGWSALPDRKERFQSFELHYQVEQAPNPSNRITLDTERDALGRRRAVHCLRFTDFDRRSYHRGKEIFAQELERAGLGRVEFTKGRFPLSMGTHHHMGTTRMHADPKQGVVDANQCLHGVGNVYLAGSSVFPTGGYANPTLTIVALSVRLGDHLKARLSHPSSSLGTAKIRSKTRSSS